MGDIFQLSEAASLGLHAMVYLVGQGERRVATGEMAQRLGVSEHHLAKILQRLNAAHLVRSTRGPRGGFQLARAEEDITLLDVYEAVEGPLTARTCLLGAEPLCPPGKCILGDLSARIHGLVYERLAGTRLSMLQNQFGQIA